MDDLPCRQPITGADHFVCALDRQMRRSGLPGNVCRVVVSLEGKLDLDRLRRSVGPASSAGWLARLRLARPLRFLSPRWQTAEVRPEPLALSVTRVSGNGALPASLPERSLRADRSPCLALDLLQGDNGASHLVLTWHHALMDVHGAELFVRLLSAEANGERGPGGSLVMDKEPTRAPGLLRRLRRYPRRLSFARTSLALITATCREPMVSLCAGAAPSRSCGYRVHWFDAEETARIDEHCRRAEAGFRRSLFYLAAAIQAVHAVAERRGAGGGAYVVPVPHDLRRRGADGPVLSNQLSFLFFRVDAAQAGDLRMALESLTEQLREQVRARSGESFLAAMELFRPLPLDLYVRQLGRPTGGRIATFFFSDAGESCAGLEEFAGARPTAITHLAPAATPPGLTVVTSRFRGRLCVVLSWAGGCLSDAEVDLLEAGMSAALLAEAPP